MFSRRPTFERVVTEALVILVVLTTLASGALVGITSVLHETTQSLSASVESVRIAEEAQRVLLIHSRSKRDIVRAQIANELQSRLADARRHINTPEEHVVFERAEQRVRAYLDATDEETRLELEPAAYEALGDLVRNNLEQTSIAQARAARGGAIAFGWWLRTRVLRPVLALAGAMKRFGVATEGSRAPEEGPEELRLVGRRFNETADRLAQNRSAHHAYLAGVAHDLRNPLGPMRLAVDSLATDAQVDPARLHRVLGILRRQIDRLTRLAEDLLDTSNLEAGRVELNVSTHDIRDIARSTVELFAASSSRHHVDLVLPPEPTVVPCDGHRIEQVLANLVGNAIKYSPAGGTVRVIVEPKANAVEIAVQDEGVGMTPEEAERIFEPFARAATVKDSVPGHGLGLFMARRIVEEHGGEMTVASVPSEGSTFRVVLPKLLRQEPARPALH
jgi:two-component system sensor histidine kinase MtrB